MRILAEASAAFAQGAGIGRYSREVLSRVIPLMPDASWTLFRTRDGVGSTYVRHNEFVGDRIRTVTAPFSRRRADQVWHRLRIPVDIRLMTGGTDLVYSPDFTAPPAFGPPRVVTIHDLAFLTHPERTTPALRRYLGRVVPWEVERATHLVAVSEATRAAMVELLSVPPARVSIVRNGVDQRFLDATALSGEQRSRLKLPETYMLMVGTIEPRKNHDAVLRVLDHLNPTLRIPLVIAGRAGWGCEETLLNARRLERQGKVVLLDYVAEADLPSLIASSAVLMYPSWTEGFGLPVIEGLATGVPVITGTAPALREVGGDMALYVDPASDEEIRDAIEMVLERFDIPEHRAARKQWAAGFDWDTSAIALRDVLREVAGHRHA